MGKWEESGPAGEPARRGGGVQEDCWERWREARNVCQERKPGESKIGHVCNKGPHGLQLGRGRTVCEGKFAREEGGLQGKAGFKGKGDCKNADIVTWGDRRGLGRAKVRDNREGEGEQDRGGTREGGGSKKGAEQGRRGGGEGRGEDWKGWRRGEDTQGRGLK